MCQVPSSLSNINKCFPSKAFIYEAIELLSGENVQKDQNAKKNGNEKHKIRHVYWKQRNTSKKIKEIEKD